MDLLSQSEFRINPVPKPVEKILGGNSPNGQRM